MLSLCLLHIIGRIYTSWQLIPSWRWWAWINRRMESCLNHTGEKKAREKEKREASSMEDSLNFLRYVIVLLSKGDIENYLSKVLKFVQLCVSPEETFWDLIFQQCSILKFWMPAQRSPPQHPFSSYHTVIHIARQTLRAGTTFSGSEDWLKVCVHHYM